LENLIRINGVKKFLVNVLYALFISGLLVSMDKCYSLINEYYLFEFTSKEFLNKMALLVLVISLIKRRRVRLAIYFTLLLFSFFQYLHFSYFGKDIGGIDFYLFFTNIHETFETLSSMMEILLYPLLLVTLVYWLIYLIDAKTSYLLVHFDYTVPLFLLSLLVISAKVFYLTNLHEGKLKHSDSKSLYPLSNRHSSRNFVISLNYFTFGILPQKLMHRRGDFPLLKKPKKEKNLESNRTIVLVIGESLRYDRFRLENNPLTPKLQSLSSDKRFFFKKVYSGGTMTKVSVSTLINRLKYPSSLAQIAQEDNCLFKLAKENGFRTSLTSAQTDFDMQMLRDMVCPKYIDTYATRNDFDGFITPTGYDEDLIAMVQSKKLLQEKSFIVLHQRGSHSPYEKQYPPSFKKFSDYNNTALYNDTQLFNLIEYLNQNIKGEFFMFYVSDHGELLGEDGKHGHGHLRKEVYEVPFIMYTNSQTEGLKKLFDGLKNHYDIATYITQLLGYNVKLEENKSRRFYILNSDLDGFSGYGVIDINNSIESKIKLKRY